MDSMHYRKTRKNIWKAIKALLRYFAKNLAHLLLCLLVLSATVVVYFFFTNLLIKDALRAFSEESGLFDVCFVISSLLVLLIGVFVFYSMIRNIIFPFRGKQRNASLLIEQLRSSDRRLPLVSIDEQIERIAGADAEQSTKDEIRDETTNIITPIKDFVLNDEKTLILDGKWGSGKTSYTLIAINEVSSSDEFEKTDYRFIYESAFKYVSNFNEFKNDIMKAIHIILSEQNMFAPSIIAELLRNISHASFHIPLSPLSGSITTTDYVERLNRKYKKRQKRNPKPFQIIIVIDDIDRLLGEDIIQTISFLSVIRRFNFVKLIIPIDRNIIISQLREAKVTDPSTYIRKHLPDQSEISIPTAFDLFEKVYARKIRKRFGATLSDEQVRPILEVICIKIFSNKLKENMAAVHISSLGDWQRGGVPFPEELSKADEYNSRYILEARDSIINCLPHSKRQLVSFHTGANDEFEALIYKLVYGDKRKMLENGDMSLRVDKELYDDCIKSWVINFSKKRWSQVGATMRTIDDICEEFLLSIDEKDYINQKLPPHKIFVRAYNKILPRWPILDENLEK